MENVTKKGYIYKITSPTGRVYIGQTNNINNRRNLYKRIGCYQQPKIYKSLIKYGFENHIFEIVEECDLEKLNTLESFYIKAYDCVNSGLNCNYGGDNKKMSQETKNKISKGNTGKIVSEETKKKMSEIMKGKNVGKTRTKEQIIKMSEAMKGRFLGRKWTEEQRKKKIGYKMSEEQKKLISESNKGFIPVNKKKVNVYLHLTNEYVGTFESIMESAKQLKISGAHINQVLSGKRNHTHGYYFELA